MFLRCDVVVMSTLAWHGKIDVMFLGCRNSGCQIFGCHVFEMSDLEMSDFGMSDFAV